MVALNTGNLDSLPSPLDTIAKLSTAVGVLDSNLDRLNRASLGRDSLFFEVMTKSTNFELDLTKQNNLLVLVNSASALTFTLTASDSVRVGMSVIFYDNTRNSETYPITINRNGNTINGASSNLTIAKNGGYVWLKCTEVGKWVSVLNSIGEPATTSSITIDASSSGYPTSIPLIRSDKFHYVEVVSTSAAMTINLPIGNLANTNIKPNDTFIIKDSSENSGTYNITVSLNGGRILGVATNPTISKNGGFIWLRYFGWDSVNNWGMWEVIASDTSNYTFASSRTINASSSGYPSTIPLVRQNKFHYVEVNSTSAAMTLQLPIGNISHTNIKTNDTFMITDITKNSETYNITINLNGGRINGSATNPVIAKNGGYIWLRYDGWDVVNSWGVWEVIAQDLTAILYSKFNPVGASAGWATTYSSFSAIFGANVLAGVSGAIGGGFYGLAYRGTLASPTATQSGDLLCHLRGHGHDGSAFVGGGGNIQITTTQNWDLTSRGGSVAVRTVANSTTTLGTAAIFGQDKTMTLSGGARMNANNTHTMFTASIAPSDTFGFNAFTTISDPRTKKNIEQFLYNEELLDKLIEAGVFISWVWKDFENQEIFQNETQIIIDAGTKEEREIEVPVLIQSYYKSNHKRRHCGSNAFRILKVLIELGISTQDFPIISIENYSPKVIDLIRNMTEEEFLSISEDIIGRLTIKNELYIPLIVNVLYRLGQKLKNLEDRLKAIETTLGI